MLKKNELNQTATSLITSTLVQTSDGNNKNINKKEETHLKILRYYCSLSLILVKSLRGTAQIELMKNTIWYYYLLIRRNHITKKKKTPTKKIMPRLINPGRV